MLRDRAEFPTKEVTKPELRCLPLPDFDAGKLEAVRAAFASAASCALGQAWRAAREPGFAPAAVRTGWRQDALLIFAELTDHDIFSRATGNNQRMWELGDTFEMFLRPDGQAEYFELHVTPNNHRLQLRFPDATALERLRATNRIDEFVLSGEAFYSRTWLQPEAHRWLVHAIIPAKLLTGEPRLMAGSRWHFSFSRYDATRGGGGPVLSSTSPHPVADFHRQTEWGEWTLAAAK